MGLELPLFKGTFKFLGVIESAENLLGRLFYENNFENEYIEEYEIFLRG